MLWVDQNKEVRDPPLLLNVDLLRFKYSYESIFESKDHPNLFGIIFKYAMATLAGIVELLYIPFDRRYGSMTILGPKWGTLTLTASLMLNQPFVLCCKIQDGQILP
jgi:hypothetical protein